MHFAAKNGLRTLAALAVMTTGVLTAPVVANAATVAPSTHTIETFAGKCLNVNGASTDDGAAIIQYTCNVDNGYTNDQFALVPFQDSGDQIQIQTFADKCLDVEGGNRNDWARIIQYTCSASENQRFTLTHLPNGKAQIKTFAGKCVNVASMNPANFASIIQYTCQNNGSVNEEFIISR
ncbi:RICIN domain-containing protein [Kitasatospora sp. NPDC048540]|uniref:RICIN domain-containing protein n=1 Tax=Kitasatospora sp. NPDC048540 TaxID=3155634 RepID=UPI003400BB11